MMPCTWNFLFHGDTFLPPYTVLQRPGTLSGHLSALAQIAERAVLCKGPGDLEQNDKGPGPPDRRAGLYSTPLQASQDAGE